MFYQQMQVYKNIQFFYDFVRKDGGALEDEATHLRIFQRSIYFDAEWNGQSFDAKFHLFWELIRWFQPQITISYFYCMQTSIYWQ